MSSLVITFHYYKVWSWVVICDHVSPVTSKPHFPRKEEGNPGEPEARVPNYPAQEASTAGDGICIWHSDLRLLPSSSSSSSWVAAVTHLWSHLWLWPHLTSMMIWWWWCWRTHASDLLPPHPQTPPALHTPWKCCAAYIAIITAAEIVSRSGESCGWGGAVLKSRSTGRRSTEGWGYHSRLWLLVHFWMPDMGAGRHSSKTQQIVMITCNFCINKNLMTIQPFHTGRMMDGERAHSGAHQPWK